MYKNPTTNLTEYETFDELLNADVLFITEDEKNYYIRVKPERFFDNCVWVVDKDTKKVSFIYYTDYLVDVIDHAVPVDLQFLKRAG